MQVAPFEISGLFILRNDLDGPSWHAIGTHARTEFYVLWELVRAALERVCWREALLISFAFMHGKVIRIIEKDKYITLLIWLQEEGFCGITYTGESYRNYQYWRDFRVGDHIGGLEWKDKGRKILDADSPVYSLAEVSA